MTYTFMGGPNEAFYQLQQSQAIAAPLPLFVGETGESTAASAFSQSTIAPRQTSREDYQDYFYRSVDAATASLGLPAAAPWILWDCVPGSISGASSDSAQYDFGIYRVDGSPKRSEATIASFFGTGAVDSSFNNGFEEQVSNGTTLLPALWQTYMPNLATFALDTTVAHTGQSSASISYSGSSTQGNPSFAIYPIAEIVPNSTHTATVWARGKMATGTNEICLSWFSASYTYLGNTCSGKLAGTTSWVNFTITGVAPATTAWVEIFLTSAQNKGTTWFDDVTFQ